MNLRDKNGSVALVGSLPFLRTGEPLCIEMPNAPPDATARAAHIAGVSVEVNPADGVPSLVVELSRKPSDACVEERRLQRFFRIEHAVVVLGCATLAMAAFLVGYVM